MSRLLFVSFKELVWSESSDEEYGDWSSETTLIVQEIALKGPKTYRRHDESITQVGVAGKVKAGDPVFLVVARYSSGDSFGSSSGEYQFLRITRDLEKAETLKENILQGTFNKLYYHASSTISDERYHKVSRRQRARLTWDGYFEYLEGVEIHPRVVLSVL